MAVIETLGMGLLFVGGVLFVNGLWLLGKGSDEDVAVFNLLTGAITFLIVLWWAFGGDATNGTAFNAAGTLLFSFTYLWISANAYRGIEDQRAFGWYCFFVAAVAVPTGGLVYRTGDVGLAGLWWLWAVLWVAFFILLGLERDSLTRPVGGFTAITGVITAIGGYIMVTGFWPIL